MSVPPAAAAWLTGTPVVCHESDLDPGLATWLNSRFADRLLVPFPESRRYYPEKLQSKILVTGVPVRRELAEADSTAGLAYIGSDGRKPVLFVVGGSQGARFLNELVAQHLDTLCRSWFVVHQTGPRWNGKESHPDYRQYEFLSKEYCDILACADCVVSRAGATTLWETALRGKAMILFPLGLQASRGDQVRNAAFFESRGAATVVETDPVDEELFLETLRRFAGDKPARDQFGRAARLLVADDAAERIASLLAGYLKD